MMQKTKEQRVHEVFEKISENYDQMNSVISFQQHNKWRNDTMHKMQVAKGSACIDVCCGTADWTIALGEAAGPTGRVVGLDFSQNMLNVGHQKTDHMPQIELVQGNAMSLPYPDNSFDFATIGFGLRNVPDYEQVLSEMHRVLKPGGMIACLETSQPESFVFKPFFRMYFRFIMPVFGKLFAKSSTCSAGKKRIGLLCCRPSLPKARNMSLVCAWVVFVTWSMTLCPVLFTACCVS